MPGGDRTGPMGMGPMTGRGAGYCAGFSGRGRRGGRGWRNRFYATGLPGWARAGLGLAGAAMAAGAASAMTREQELDSLKQQADQAAGVLENIRRRIDELQGKTQP